MSSVAPSSLASIPFSHGTMDGRVEWDETAVQHNTTKHSTTSFTADVIRNYDDSWTVIYISLCCAVDLSATWG